MSDVQRKKIPIKAFVNSEIEVDIDIYDVFEVIEGMLKNADIRSIHATKCSLSNTVGFLKRIPDSMILEFTDKDREVVHQSLLDQANRWQRKDGE